MPWVNVTHTFKEGFQKETERRYRVFHVCDVIFDRLFFDITGHSIPLLVSHNHGFSLFQSMLEVSHEYKEIEGAEIWAYGFDCSRGIWALLVKHPSFDPVSPGEIPPEECLTYQDGDMLRIKRRFEQRQREMEDLA